MPPERIPGSRQRVQVDAHHFPFHDKKLHTIGAPHACRCEPTVPYIEVTPDGAIWRRVIRHGKLG